MTINRSKKGGGTRTDKQGRKAGKFRILISWVGESGVPERRQTDNISKAQNCLRGIRRGPIKVACSFVSADNTGVFPTRESARHFLQNNWQDYQIWRKDGDD